MDVTEIQHTCDIAAKLKLAADLHYCKRLNSTTSNQLTLAVLCVTISPYKPVTSLLGLMLNLISMYLYNLAYVVQLLVNILSTLVGRQ